MIARTLFNDEHDTFRASLKRFIATELAPHREEWERTGIVSREAWERAGAAGFLCCTVPEAYGGPGGDFLYSAIVVEEMAIHGGGGPPFYLQSDMAAPYVMHFGTEAQKHELLPRLAAGTLLTAIAMTEPSAGSDLQAIRTTARRDGDDYVINGQKTFISNGQQADLVIVACKTDPTAGAKGISLILVETDRPGFRRGRLLEKVGNKAHGTAELFFDDVRVPATNLLGVENRGFIQLMGVLPQERLVQAVRGVAVAEAALQWTIDYVCERRAFGKAIADYQNTQFKIAEMHSEILAQRVFVDHCIRLHTEGKLDAVDAAKAKLLGTELQGRVVDTCVQFFGGYGYMWEYPIARAYADARVTRITGGASEIMKQIIARSLLPQPPRG